MTGADEPDRVEAGCAAALAALPGAGPVALARLLETAGGPRRAWELVCAGEVAGPTRGAGSRRSWAESARQTDTEAQWAARAARGIQVTWLGASSYPAVLRSDPEPPAVLFWRGDLRALGRRRVAVVGTRRCTPDGALCGAELGHDLAAAGACVVSGLALGIDAAAHRGALRSCGPGVTVGVAASGVDVPYPRSHAGLWEEVSLVGAVLSETPPGRPAQSWRFPLRNRIIAGLAEVVVVVESHRSGGTLHTVDAALDRGITVAVVPGAVRSSASAGTNALLRDGAVPVRNAEDVLELLGVFRSSPAQAGGRRAGEPRELLGTAVLLPGDAAVLGAVGYRPASLAAIVDGCGRPVAEVAGSLERLRVAGRVVEQRGWWQRC
jgi:DNA processing protein